jgi:hypothetical protein
LSADENGVPKLHRFWMLENNLRTDLQAMSSRTTHSAKEDTSKLRLEAALLAAIL